MFTGLVQQIGTVAEIVPCTDHADSGQDLKLVFQHASPWQHPPRRGDSIAINGVCLTVTEPMTKRLVTDVSRETLACTTLGTLAAGQRVNLEPALRAGEPLGGHLVSGHVDGVGKVCGITPAARSHCFEFSAPGKLMAFIAPKGAICVDGVSLTVNTVAADRFRVNIIPHTLANTIFADYRAGTTVNLEADMVARYLQRLMETTPP